MLAKPMIMPHGGEFVSPRLVEISHPDPAVVIRYTTDGTPVNRRKPLYTGSFEIVATEGERVTIIARAFLGTDESDPITEVFTAVAAAPAPEPGPAPPPAAELQAWIDSLPTGHAISFPDGRIFSVERMLLLRQVDVG